MDVLQEQELKRRNVQHPKDAIYHSTSWSSVDYWLLDIVRPPDSRVKRVQRAISSILGFMLALISV